MKPKKNISNIYPLMRVKDGFCGFQVWYQPKYKTTVHYTHKPYKFVCIIIQKIVENKQIWETTCKFEK